MWCTAAERGWKPIAHAPASSTSRCANSKPDVSPVRWPDRSFTVTYAGDGTYNFYTVATDKAGNVEAAPAGADATTTYTLDTVAPTSQATVPTWSTPTVTVSYTAADTGELRQALVRLQGVRKGLTVTGPPEGPLVFTSCG